MLTETWERHIMDHRTGPGFSYLRSKVPLIQRAISSVQDTQCFFRLSDYLKNEWSMDYACPDFRPTAEFLRIAFKRLEDGTIIITSAYKITRGILKYEP